GGPRGSYGFSVLSVGGSFRCSNGAFSAWLTLYSREVCLHSWFLPWLVSLRGTRIQMACHLVYLTMNSFDEMTQGSTAAFYDRHLANLLEAVGELTVLHFHASGGQGCRAHPRLGPRVSHRDGDSSSLTIRALWRWIMRGGECIRGDTMLYLP